MNKNLKIMKHFHKKRDIYEEQRRKEISSCLDRLQKMGGVDTSNLSDVIKLLESQNNRVRCLQNLTSRNCSSYPRN